MQTRITCDTTSHQLEWPLSKRWKITHIGKDVKKGSHCTLLVGM
jgi:hypothetical protein